MEEKSKSRTYFSKRYSTSSKDHGGFRDSMLVLKHNKGKQQRTAASQNKYYAFLATNVFSTTAGTVGMVMKELANKQTSRSKSHSAVQQPFAIL